MPLACPICSTSLEKFKSMYGGDVLEDYICRSCHIAWHLDELNRLQIRVSSTHAHASKLSDEEFKKLLEKIAEYEKKKESARV